MKRQILILGALVGFGCSDPLKEQSRVEEMRVLGAEVQIDGAPQRASVNPGESLSVRWLVASPSGQVNVGWAFTVCVAKAAASVPLVCADAAFAEAASAEVSGATPVFNFAVPEGVAGGTKLQVSGLICDNGQADLASSSCGGGGRAEKVSFEITVNGAGFENQNPDLAQAVLNFDGAEFSAGAEPQSSECDDPNSPLLRIVADGASHHIGVALQLADREFYTPYENQAAQRETLRLSNFATLGAFDRPMHIMESSAAEDAAFDLVWLAPDRVDAPAVLTHFWFVARDGRGGLSFTRRSICTVSK